MGQYQKGHPGGPGRGKGRPKIAEDLREVKVFNKDEWTRMFNRFFFMTMAELESFISKRKEQRVGDLLVASIVHAALKGGDEKKLNFMLDRTIGRVTDKIEITPPQPFIIRRRDGSEEVMGAKTLTPEEIEERADKIRETTTAINFRGAEE